MTTPKNQPKRPVGRPALHLPPRKRKNLNIQRTEEFDANLLKARQLIATDFGIPLEEAYQTIAVQLAVKFFVENCIKSITDKTICPRCNGVGYITIKNGDDDQPCPECSE